MVSIRVWNVEDKNEVRKDFFEIVMAQHDTAPEMKPKSFMKGLIAGSIVRPSTKSDVKNALTKGKCVIRGSGTTFTASILPHEDETIIAMGSMQDVSIKKKTATVDAGTPFYKIINEARKHSLEVPCYPLTYHAATIGGFISNNGIVGFNSRGTGHLYDYIEEMEVLTSSGTTYKVRGDDVTDFFGAEGQLGVILKVKLNLIERETRYIHMYGFDGIEDVLRFLEMNDDIYAAYMMNRTALDEFETTLQLKHVPEFSLLVIDKNWKDDYKKELRTDLAQMGVSHIFPKEVLAYCFKRIGTLELSIAESKNYLHIGDGIIDLDDLGKATAIARKEKVPLFSSIGKQEALFRVYADCRGALKKQKYLAMMDRLHMVAEPNCVGSFFAKNLKGKARERRLQEALGKYDTKHNVLRRVQLYKRSMLLRPLVAIAGGALW
ncbi:MAG: FAD-binding oxidoreductase [Nanoarchaeota archaeon]